MFDLALYLPYLVDRAGARLAGSLGEALARCGTTVPVWRVLSALHHRGGQRVGQLAETTSIEISTLSRLLGALERKGLLRRQRSQADARTVTVRLSESGSRLAAQIVPMALHYEAAALRDFTPEEAATLKAMLVRVHENLGMLDEEERRSA